MELIAFLNYLEYEKRYSKHTVTAYKQDLEQFSNYLVLTYQISDWIKIKSIHLRSWVVYLMQKDMNATTIHRKISTLKSYHKFLLITQAIPIMTFPHVLLPKKAERLPAFVEQDQLDKIQTMITFPEGFVGLRDYLLLEVLYVTGMRRSELIALEWKHINMEYGQLKVLGKGNKARLLPFGAELKETLLEYKQLLQETFTGEIGDTVFITDKGKPMYPKFVYNKVKRYLSLVTTAKKKSPHVLRHSFATHLSNNGADLNAIKELLGHANLAATQVYTHNSIEQLKKVYEQAHPKAKK
jgi:integrase/recombinase XerC